MYTMCAICDHIMMNDTFIEHYDGIVYICVCVFQVTTNPKMAGDTRNLAVIGMSDGIPMFRDKDSRSVTPIALRTANLPDDLSMKFRHIHLAALYPNEYWRLSEENEDWERAPHKPSSLSPLMYVLVDDLLSWEDGQWVEDHNLPEGHQDRMFKLCATLLYWTGDYPGLGEATDFMHSGKNACHWCWVKGVWENGLGRSSYGEYPR
jgi:hypothetical protein